VNCLGDLRVQSGELEISRTGERADDDIGTRGGGREQLATDRPQAASDAVANDRSADTLGDDEPESGRRLLARSRRVDDGMWGRDPATRTHDGTEVRTDEHSVRLSEHD